MRHPKEIGDRSTLAIMYALRSQGAAILVPVGENTRYDLVVDEGGRLTRLQCKTGRLRNGAVPKNNQAKGVHLAAAYEIARIDLY